MPRPGAKNPRDVLEASWLNGLLDWVEDEQVGVTLPVTITTDQAGWYTIAQGDARRASVFVVTEGTGDRHNRCVFEALWAFGGGSVERARVREISYVRYRLRTVHGARILREDGDLTYGTAKVQVYLDPQGASVTYRIYRIDLHPAEPDWQPWDLVSPPVQENAPSGYSPHVWAVAGGRGKVLVKTGLSGGSGSGTWMSTSQKANWVRLSGGADCLFDGNTSSNCVDVYAGTSSYDWVTRHTMDIEWRPGGTAQPVKLDAIRGYFGVWNDDPAYVRMYVYYWDGSAWQNLGYAESGLYNNSGGWLEKSFTPTTAARWRVLIQTKVHYNNTESTIRWREVGFRQVAGFEVGGVPAGAAVRLVKPDGSTVSTVTAGKDGWAVFSVDPSQANGGGAVEVSYPGNSSLVWARYPDWCVWPARAFENSQAYHLAEIGG